MQPICQTAQWTAAIRAMESARTKGALFQDRFALILAEPDGFKLLQRYRGAGVQEFVVIRTRYFDDACAAALAGQPSIRQVVAVAAGMDTRPFRLDWPDGVKFYELDHHALLNEKAKRLASQGATPRATRVSVALDLAANWLPLLVEADFNPHCPTLWLVEGLLFFLTQAQVQDLLSTIRMVSAPGSRLVADVASMSLLRSPFSQLFLSKLRSDGVPWLFGTDNPESFLAEQGWTICDLKEPGEPGAGGNRWPYPVYPRHLAGVPRSWLITAVRTE